MIMKLPIQDRKAIIHKHNLEQEQIDARIHDNGQSSTERHYEGEQLNDFARLEQMRRKNGG